MEVQEFFFFSFFVMDDLGLDVKSGSTGKHAVYSLYNPGLNAFFFQKSFFFFFSLL